MTKEMLAHLLNETLEIVKDLCFKLGKLEERVEELEIRDRIDHDLEAPPPDILK